MSRASWSEDASVRAQYVLLGRRLADAREAAGHKQDYVARRMRVSRAAVANMELGRQRVAVHQLLAYAEAIGVEPGDLLPSRAELPPPASARLQHEGITAVDVLQWTELALRKLDRGEAYAQQTNQSGAGSEPVARTPRSSRTPRGS